MFFDDDSIDFEFLKSECTVADAGAIGAGGSYVESSFTPHSAVTLTDTVLPELSRGGDLTVEDTGDASLSTTVPGDSVPSRQAVCTSCNCSEDTSDTMQQQQQQPAESAAAAGSGAAARLKRLVKGLLGWRKCKGEAHLLSQLELNERRAIASARLSGLRIWSLMFMLLMGRPAQAVDLCGGEGAFSHGLALGGWRVHTVELVDRAVKAQHPNITRHVGDALKFDLTGIDAGFGSPPCQPFSMVKELDLIGDIRSRFESASIPYMIANVAGARKQLRSPIGVCGTMFGLGVARHRLLETSIPPLWHDLECQHDGMCLGTRTVLKRRHKDGTPRYCCPGNMFGVYGSPSKVCGSRAQWADAMGALFLSSKGLALSLPPAYGQYAGAMMLAQMITTELDRRGHHSLAEHMRSGGLFDIHLQLPVYQQLKSVAEAAGYRQELRSGVALRSLPSSKPVERQPKQQLLSQLPLSSGEPCGKEAAANEVPTDVAWQPPCEDVDWGEFNYSNGSGSPFELTPYDLSVIQYSNLGVFHPSAGWQYSHSRGAALWFY